MVCVLLLLFAAALAAVYWAGAVRSELTSPDEGAVRSVAPSYYAYTHGHGYDFFQYYAGGHNWRIGLDPYRNHPRQPDAIQSPREQDPAVSGFIYPPAGLPVYGLLSRLPYESARYLWALVNIALFAVAIGIAAWSFPGRRLEVVTAAVVLIMCSYPFLYHLHQGQVDMIVSALSVSAFVLYGRWRNWPTAALLAAAILVKVTPVLLVGVMVLYFRDVRLVLKTVMMLVAAVLASLLAVSPHLYVEYLVTTLPKAAIPDLDWYNQTIVRFWAFDPSLAKLVSALGYVALFFIAFASGRNRRALGRHVDVDLRTERHALLLLTVVMTLLFSPLTWQMTYVMAIIPLALLLVSSPAPGREWSLVAIGLGAALMSGRIYDVPVLSVLNVVGGVLAASTVMIAYLPLFRVRARPLVAGDLAAAQIVSRD